MEKNKLFPVLNGLAHGCDYNPEQWLKYPDILKKDVEMMKKAGINCVTLGVFSWSVYEPAEGEFHFDWLREIMDHLYENGIYTILATPTGARPAWLDEKYPEAMRVSRSGVRNHHGVRHNFCMSSEKYREKTAVLDRKLAEQFGHHPGLLMYHISNELGGECYCPKCVKRFQDYLAEKFDHDIEKLNDAWWTTFWSHRYDSFEQVEPPFSNGEGSIMGLNMEWKRFTTWNMADFLQYEIDVLRSVSPDVPVTTNFMMLYNGLDYRELEKKIDVISWDSYPRFHNDYETMTDTMLENAFHNTVMRSMKRDKPFMLMESAPGLVNWHDYNKMKRPGVHRLFGIQTVACGSDTVQYFQWRKGRGSFEQHHGAVVDHLGTDDTRVFREVEELGALLKKLAPVAGTVVKARTAMLFDWDNRWAIQEAKMLGSHTKKYEEICIGIWKEFAKMGVEMDIIPSDGDMSGYDVLVAPMLYQLQPQTAEKLKAFVKRGGQLLATYLTGYVDKNQLCYLGGFPGDGLSELFGVISEEIDTLYPSDSNAVCFPDGEEWEVKEYAEYLRVKDAEVLAAYKEDYYQGTAAVTCKEYGEGSAYYVAARISPAQMRPLFMKMLEKVNITAKSLPADVERHERSGGDNRYVFYLNHGEMPAELEVEKGVELLSGAAVDGKISISGYGAAVIEIKAQA